MTTTPITPVKPPMTEEQIVRETIELYSTTLTRATSNECYYFEDEKHNRCAVGRCLLETTKLPDIDNSQTISSLMDFNTELFTDNERETHYRQIGFSDTDYFLDKLVKEKYRGHSSKFWASLQVVHDSESFWAGKTFTNEGKDYVLRTYKFTI